MTTNINYSYVFQHPYFELTFASLLDRDRFYLARARPFYLSPYSTPTLKVRPAYVQVMRSQRLSVSRWERSPLHKRALARR